MPINWSLRRGEAGNSCVLRLRLLAAAAALVAGEGLDRSAWADTPTASIEGVQDRALRQAIQHYVGSSKRSPHSRFEARQRAEQAAQDAVVVLRSEGYYDYTVAPGASQGDRPQPVVRIDPGPRYAIADPQVGWVGGAPDAKAAADAMKALRLPAGTPGRAADVIAAEGRLVAALQRDGYADAEPAPREVVVDHDDRTVRPSFHIKAKSKVRLDGLQVKTKGRTRPHWTARLAPWRKGAVYSPAALAELERRLIDTGVYNSVNVALAPAPDSDGLRPVIVSLTDRPKSSLSLGGSYATQEGPGADAVYTIYNRFGRADTITLNAQYASILKRIDLTVAFPDWLKPLRTLSVGATAYQDDTTAFTERDAGVHSDLQWRFGNASFRTLGLSVDYSDDDEKILQNGQIVGVDQKLELFTGLARLALDHSNDVLNPTRGWRLDLRVDPTLGTGDDLLAYAKFDVVGSAYVPFNAQASTVLAGRAELGSIVSGGSTFDIPASRRFYAGGAGSVRGYAYQAVGPRFPDNTPIGGLSLAEASAEIRQTINSRWGAVLFVDAGTVGPHQYFDFKSASIGAGIGVRYNLGFAPLRLDIGFPVNPRTGDAPVQLYFSIGQSF